MVAGLVLIAPLFLTAARPAPPAPGVGRVVALSGDVHVQHGSAPKVAAARGDYVQEGDIVETGERGSVRLLMRDKSVLALTDRSRLKITAYEVQPQLKHRRARLTILAGRLWALVSEALHPEARYDVQSATAVAGVRGTELVFDVTATGSSSVTVLCGHIDLGSATRHETLGERERASVGDSGAIALRGTSEALVTELRDAARPKQALDAANAPKRLRALRRKSRDAEATEPDLDLEPQGAEQTEPASRDSPSDGPPGGDQEDNGGGQGPGDDNPTVDLFDPSTMARVRVSVQVRP